MTVLVLADLHLNDNPRDRYRHDFMESLPEIAQQNGVDAVIVLGDLTEEKDRHGAWLVNAVADHFDNLAQNVEWVIILKGNHDYADAAHPFFKWLKHLAGVLWIGEPTDSHKLHRDVQRRIPDCVFLPHTHRWEEEWDDLQLDKRDFIFAHNTFAGAVTEHGKTLDGIPLGWFPKYTRVISGDIHTPQILEDDGRTCHYVGAPYTVDFGDSYGPRLFVIDGQTLNEIGVVGPQKRLVEMTLDAPPTNGPLHEWMSYAYPKVDKGDIVKVRIKLAARYHEHRAAVRKAVSAWAQQEGLRLHQVQFVVDRTRSMAPARATHTIRSDQQLLAYYAGARGVDELTIKAGHRLMRKA